MQRQSWIDLGRSVTSGGRRSLRAMVMAAMLFCAGSAAAQDIPDWAVTATGIGEIEQTPDIAYFEAATVAVAKTANEAKDSAALTARAVLSALANQGVAAADVQTSTIALMPIFAAAADGAGRADDATPQIASYRARISHRIVVRALADLGKIIDGAVGAGAQEIKNVGFGVAEPAVMEGKALRAAIADARRMAEIVAEEGAFRLGPIIAATVLDQPGSVVPNRLMSADAASSVPIQPGRVAVRMRVRVLFAIDDMPDALMDSSATSGGAAKRSPANPAPQRAATPRAPAPTAAPAPVAPSAAPAPAARAPAPSPRPGTSGAGGASDLFTLPDPSASGANSKPAPGGLFDK